MSLRQAYRLLVANLPGYEARIAALCDAFSAFRAEAIDWRPRIEAWLGNFQGFVDQDLALGMLERLRVVSYTDEVAGCQALLERIQQRVPQGGRLFHVAHETSGGLLLRILEKELRVEGSAILRPYQLDRGALSALMRRQDVVTMWDRFNGTGGQLASQVEAYRPRLLELKEPPSALHFAYLAGHPPKGALPSIVFVDRWIEDVPVVSAEERDLCMRYANAAGSRTAAGKYDTGALIAFSDNLPNNVPHVIWAKESERWAPLLQRKGTLTGRR
ncbi:hypothetical protein WMF38_30235 [Sorangium sp. So ce118]